ncbi:IclR family transcriptional regulator [Salinibacterium sp. dk2585]|nr:IclR family transcriptional regulator [Salinibacterium sp. dk2585]TXK52788.1 IclR family transcriptional regulator [Salinibacterium sp. dk5596]
MHVVVRALSVLTALSDRREGLTLQQLHRELDIPLGSIHRLLRTLESERFVQRSPQTKRYSLGPSALALGYHQQFDSYLIAPPEPLLVAGRDSGETVFLTRMVDSRVVCIALVESRHPLRLFVRVGQEMPLHAAASARIVLAHKDPTLVEALLTGHQLEAFTRGTVREVNQLIDHLATARRRGFDVCRSELDDDVWAVAAPVYDAAGHVECGIALAAAAGRVETIERRADYTEIVMRAAEALSRAQGYAGPIATPTREELLALYSGGDSDNPFDNGTTMKKAP